MYSAGKKMLKQVSTDANFQLSASNLVNWFSQRSLKLLSQDLSLKCNSFNFSLCAPDPSRRTYTTPQTPSWWGGAGCSLPKKSTPALALPASILIFMHLPWPNMRAMFRSLTLFGWVTGRASSLWITLHQNSLKVLLCETCEGWAQPNLE